MSEGQATRTAQQAEAAANAPPFKVSDLLGLHLHLRNRIESEWQRVVYLHAALIGVLIFFADKESLFLPARLGIAVFYTFAIVTARNALAEAYGGLREVTRDLREHPDADPGSNSHAWICGLDYSHALWTRTALLGAVWLVVAYLLFAPVLRAGL